MGYKIKSPLALRTSQFEKAGLLEGTSGVKVGECSKVSTDYMCDLFIPDDTETLKTLASNLINKSFAEPLKLGGNPMRFWDPTLKKVIVDGELKFKDQENGVEVDGQKGGFDDRVIMPEEFYQKFIKNLEAKIQAEDPTYSLPNVKSDTSAGAKAPKTGLDVYCNNVDHPDFTIYGQASYVTLDFPFNDEEAELFRDVIKVEKICIDKRKDDKKYLKFNVANQAIADLLESIKLVSSADYSASNETNDLHKRTNEFLQKVGKNKKDDLIKALENFQKDLVSTKDLPSPSWGTYLFQAMLAAGSLIGSFFIFRSLYKNQSNLAQDGIKEDDLKRDWLKEFGTDLNDKFKDHETNPAIGRESETNEVIKILTRNQDINQETEKGEPNAPAVTGEAGVGKTSLIEALAWMIEKKDPKVEKLHGYTIISLDLTKLAAGFGTSHINDLPRIVKNIIKSAQDKHGKVIIYIDEVHRLMEIGKHAKSDQSVAEMFKEVMGRGEILVVVSTTTKEFRQHVEQNEAFLRRLVEIPVLEPSADALNQIINLKIRSLSKKYPGFTVDKSLYDQIPKLAKKYFPKAGANPAASLAMLNALYEYQDKQSHISSSQIIDQSTLDAFVNERRLARMVGTIGSLLTEVSELYDKFEQKGFFPDDLAEKGLTRAPQVDLLAVTGLRDAAAALREVEQFKAKLEKAYYSLSADSSNPLAALMQQVGEQQDKSAPNPVATPPQPTTPVDSPINLTEVIKEAQAGTAVETYAKLRRLLSASDEKIAVFDSIEKLNTALAKPLSNLSSEDRCRLLFETLEIYKGQVDRLAEPAFRNHVVAAVSRAVKQHSAEVNRSSERLRHVEESRKRYEDERARRGAR